MFTSICAILSGVQVSEHIMQLLVSIYAMSGKSTLRNINIYFVLIRVHEIYSEHMNEKRQMQTP